MKNLILLGERRRSLHYDPKDLSSSTSNADGEVVDVCQVLPEDLDSESSTVVLTTSGTVTKVNDNGDVMWSTNLDHINDGGGWFDLTFVDPELVCLSKRGVIVTVSPSTGEATLVGIFDLGLQAASWSPDGEILLMVTSTEVDDDNRIELQGDEPRISQTQSVLMSMNAQFEVLDEITIPTYVSPSTPSDSSRSMPDDSEISVTWRPDGSLCAVSSVDVEDKTRKVRIYKRETLELHAVGRAEDGSGTLVKNLQCSTISWAGTRCSQLLAGVQRKGKKTQQVVFFESNGLRHREFLLRENPSTNVISLIWNVASDLLAVSLREENGTDKVQLWHRCNYHWYLKREFRFDGRRIVRIKFSEEKAHQLLILLNNLEWREYELRWDPSTPLVFQEKCLSCVVDGCSFNVTAFDKALIPPPMFADSSTTEYPISEVCFCDDSSNIGSSLLYLSSGDLVFLFYESGSVASFRQSKVIWGDMKDVDKMTLRSFNVLEGDTNELHVVAIQSALPNVAGEKLVEFTIRGVGTSEPMADVTNSYLLEDKVLRMVAWADFPNGCLIQLQDSSLLEYERSLGIALSEAEPLMEPCPWMVAVKDSSLYGDTSQSDTPRTRLIFGLSARSRLYFNDVMVTDSASSFFLSMAHEFFCFVAIGSTFQLRFLPLKELHGFDPLMGLDESRVMEGYEPRNVEQGAKILAILPEQPLVVLQMPRGNLEGIFPRALVLRFVMNKVSENAFGEAFRMMRKHKVDLNLIVDLDPWGFLRNGISSFIEQVNVIDHLNLFISTLQNFDATESKFPVPRWFQPPAEIQKEEGGIVFDFSTKVNQICIAARSIMVDIEQKGDKPNRYYLLPILSTFAKENPPRLDEALSLIKEDALSSHSKTKSKNPLFSETAQHSIHYLAFLAEYELLFETALGMYDFEIARAVARNSQMDPKVYLPLLKRYNELPIFYARYEVDIRLKRFESALTNLCQSFLGNESLNILDNGKEEKIGSGNSFEECMELIMQQNLHKRGLELFCNDNMKMRIILISLGENLLREGRPQIALSVYLSADPPDLEGAKRAAKAASDWKSYFSIFDREHCDVEQQEFKMERRRLAGREIADEIVRTASTNLPELRREIYSNAARVLLDYGNDVIGTVDLLVGCESWKEGYRIAAHQSRQDLMKKCVDGAVNYAYTSIDEFSNRITEFEQTLVTYAEVLKLRLEKVALEGPDPIDDVETGSLFSAASTSSNMSLRSNTSSSSAGSGVSSIISIKSATTFTMTGGDGKDRHRSKFNKGKKPKRHSRKPKQRQLPGSHEELVGLVNSLKILCPDANFATAIGETIQFLILVQHCPLAEELYKAYTTMCDAIGKSLAEGLDRISKQKAGVELHSHTEGHHHEPNHQVAVLPIEKELDVLFPSKLDSNLLDFFNYI
jgi:elongator complex protein 1